MDVEKLDLLCILVGMSNGTATLENNLTVSNKTKHTINMTTWLRNCTLEDLSEENKNFCSHKNLYTNVPKSFSPNSKYIGNNQNIFQWINDWANSDAST